LPVLAAQPGKLFTLGAAQPLLAGQRFACVPGGLGQPVDDGLRSGAELACQIGLLPAWANSMI
jgi:hypothetical protein